MNIQPTGATAADGTLPSAARSAASVGLWLLVWMAGLSALIWVASDRLVPAMESRTAAAVTALLADLDGSPFDVSVQGYTTRLSGTVTDDAQRLVMIEAAYRVKGVREVVDELEVVRPVGPTTDIPPAPAHLQTPSSLPAQGSGHSAALASTRTDTASATAAIPAGSSPKAAADELLDPLALSSATSNDKAALTPRRRADERPRTQVFGSILPPWRAPAIFKPTPADPAETAIVAELGAMVESDPAAALEREQVKIPEAEPVAVLDSEPVAAQEPEPVAVRDRESVEELPGTGSDEQLRRRFDELASADIAFRIGSHQLTTSSQRTLDELATLLSQFSDAELDIGGHTDSAGAELNNLYLSQARSNRVRDYLATRGVSPYRMLAHGYGESLPIASNDSASGRAANRRIELQLR